MPITCRTCGAVASHLTIHCPKTRVELTAYTPLVSEVDPAWESTVRDLSDPEYIAWLECPHDLVMKELDNLTRACERLKHDIELDGAVKQLMLSGWRHGPYVHDPKVPQAKWKKFRLKVQIQEEGRVCFLRNRNAIHFEDTTGQLRTLNAVNFFTKETPEDNQLKHVTNAVKNSPEWKSRERPCKLTVEELAKRVLQIFPEVQYRREGHVKIFVCSKRQPDKAVYKFIEEELRSAMETEYAAHTVLPESAAASFAGAWQKEEGCAHITPLAIPESWEDAVSDVEATVAETNPLGKRGS
eukprot:TRINITY_DN19602_c0_g1_i2.p1 TRINITY_DN19602_c0_g1~~TRINITY_DN19602_c0_g1_i2.p1  ORF type:complete len:298 (-),score=37.72 TRINITY_DN19602_c0_g1_i2:535-1428(-)